LLQSETLAPLLELEPHCAMGQVIPQGHTVLGAADLVIKSVRTILLAMTMTSVAAVAAAAAV
jgi:hypothetical protein